MNPITQQDIIKMKKFSKDTKNNIFSKPGLHFEQEQSEESDDGKDMLGMVDKDDLVFLRKAIASRSYNILKNVKYFGLPKSRKRKLGENEERLEQEYEDRQKQTPIKYRNALPIKTKDGFISQRVLGKTEDTSMVEPQEIEEISGDNEEYTVVGSPTNDSDISEPISAAQLMSQRNQLLSQRKMEIGVLSAQVLENPDEKISNLRVLLKIMDEQNPEVFLTVRKLATASILEVFKDIIPTYKIRSHRDEKVLLKKSTLKLRKFETELLQHYKKFLHKLEKSCMVLQKKKGSINSFSKGGKVLGELALHSMCDLLVTQPYFNFSENIAQVVVPFLNHRDVAIRKLVKSAIETVFGEDKKREITLNILRIINHYLKAHAHYFGLEMLEVLLVLRLKNLEQNNELDTKQKKLISKQQNVLQISKKERKRKKQLKRLENELLETKAEENQQTKQKNTTEITKLVFNIYFTILKSSTNNKAVEVCLEGLAKYAHFINLEYYIDIVNLLDQLLKDKSLLFRQQLHCIKTVFVILNGQGESLNLDPTRFYNNLYNHLFHISANSKMHYLQLVMLQILSDSLIKRSKKITNKRIIGFIKRLTIVSLQLLHHGTLGILGVISIIMRASKSVDILLDTENTVGNGIYTAELEDPEYANASSTALYETMLLHKHYHPIVRKFSENIASGLPSTGESSLTPELAKLRPEDIFQEYDMAEMTFNPSVPVPRRCQFKARMKHNNLLDGNFENYCTVEGRSQIRKGIVCME